MSIITISRGSYSRGKEVAEAVARELGYECVSRDILLEASDEFNIPEFKLIRALHDAPSVLERFHHGKRRYITYLRSALLQHVQRDNVVYHGLAGQYFLQNIPHVLKVRILADMEDRIKEEMKRENISAEAALYILKKDDDERRKWGIQVYGTDTWDSRLYDMVLNIKTLRVAHAVEIICETVAKPVFQTTPESRKIIDDLTLAARVEAAIVRLAPMLAVSADSGVVSIAPLEPTPSLDRNLIAEVERLASEVEGVREVIVAIGHEQSRHVNPFHNI
jgi:cytidylate kinase